MLYTQIVSNDKRAGWGDGWMRSGEEQREERKKELEPAARLRISMTAAPAVSFGGCHRSLQRMLARECRHQLIRTARMSGTSSSSLA